MAVVVGKITKLTHRRGFPTSPQKTMPKLKHIDLKHHPYMVTAVTADRRPIFRDPKSADIVLDAIFFGKEQGWYYLLAFVIMPDHIHLIVVPEEKNISECMKAIKGFSAREINKLYQRSGTIWQRSFYDYILEGEAKALGRIRYIEYNPVRKGLAANSGDYEYSSARYRDRTDFEKFFK
jgi:REP element-mobilizing transposase RayT